MGWKTKTGRSQMCEFSLLAVFIIMDSGVHHMCYVKICVVLLHLTVDIQNILHDLLVLNVIVILWYGYDPFAHKRST